MSLRDDVNALNSMILQGQIMEAFDKYYADDLVMQENNGEPRVGKATNQAVVYCIAIIIIINFFLSQWLYGGIGLRGM